MKLLWRDAWLDVPGYEVPEGAVLVEVSAAVPLARVENASGRRQRRPGRKVAVFLLTDGPRSTVRKARTKRDEPRFTGDYRITVVLGRELPSGPRVVALATRVPPAAQQLVLHRDLVQPVPDGFSDGDLRQVAARLSARADELAQLGRQIFLYSGMAPPAGLTVALQDALSLADGSPALASSAEVISPPAGDGKEADTVMRLKPASSGGGLPVAVLGAGDYTRTEIIPALRRAQLNPYAVANREPQIAALVGREYGFTLATTDAERAIAETPAPGLVVVATAHDSHTRLACSALEAGHRVFVEKPPVVTEEDVYRLVAAMRAHPGAVEIGFNRRYHPLVRRARARLRQETGPVSISCLVKELTFEPDHWYFWPNQATRITGNLCHWIDLAVFLLEDQPMPVSLTLSPRMPGTEPGSDEERVLTVTFDDGSLLTVLGTTRGDDIRGVQEQIDIRRGKTSITIDDLWKIRVRSEGLERFSRTLYRDKAHTTMYREALGRIVAGQSSVYPVRDLVVVSAIQIAASKLARTDQRSAELPDWLTLAEEDAGIKTGRSEVS
jgi:predicted dehydrogenase